MIFRRYGTSFQSVDINFDSKALNEIGFRRNHQESMSVEDFEAGFGRGESHNVSAEAEGPVQDHTEQLLLDRLKEQLVALEANLAEGDVLVIENEQGHDWPKTKQTMAKVVVQGENKLYFSYSLSPAIRATVFRRGG